jgi:hypothetical protein
LKITNPGVINVSDRHAIPWASDAAYNFNALFDDNLKAIPHTADTVTIEFFHGFDLGATNGYQDEGIAIDGFTLFLVGSEISAPIITSIDPSGGPVILTWTDTTAGATYIIQRSTDLVTWDEIDDGATGNTFTDSSPLETPSIFYRIIRN